MAFGLQSQAKFGFREKLKVNLLPSVCHCVSFSSQHIYHMLTRSFSSASTLFMQRILINYF
jgi:hypothetical protein